MKLITGPDELSGAIARGLRKYQRLRWSIAWASFDFPLCRRLLAGRAKIAQLVVGTHFYQTHPEFLSALINHPSLRVVLLPSGVFHPKIYLFENSPEDWACIVGSPNFSGAAFAHNIEMAVGFDSSEPNAADLYSGIRHSVDQHWRQGVVLTSNALSRYRVLRQHYKPKLIQIAADFGPRSQTRPPADIEMFGWDWAKFVRRVRNDQRHDFQKRLAVLAAIRSYFREDRHLAAMTRDQRARIAGIAADEDEHPWRYFGSMFPAGMFKNAVSDRLPTLSRALDAIPAVGVVTRSHYDTYIALFRRAFPKGGDGVGGASRLLCMKRPDLFLCVNSKNRDGLCRALNIPKSKINYASYWDEIVQRIQATPWWNAPEPARKGERQIWLGRAALLDSLYYDPSG